MHKETGTRERSTLAHLLPGVPCIEKLRNRGDELRWRKRFFEKNAVGHATRGPAPGRRSGDVNDREGRIDLSGLASNFPTVHSTLEIDIGYKGRAFENAAS